MKAFLLLSVMFMAGTAVPALAQEPKFPETVRPIPQEETAPEGRVIDVVGLQLGDTFESTKAKMIERMGADAVEVPFDVMFLRDDRNNEFKFIHHEQVKGFRALDGNGSEMIIAYFTTAATEERVLSIERQVMAPEQNLSIPDTIAGLTEKYGPTSFREEMQGVRLLWVWHNGKHVDFSTLPTMAGAPDSAEFCGTATGPARYGFGGLSTPVPGCDTVIEVSFLLGQRADLASSMSLKASDHKRLTISQSVTDAELDKEFKAYFDQKAGTSPDL